MTVTSGRNLDNGKLHGIISILSSKSQWMPVNQEKPAEAEWRLWRKANRLWSMEDGTLRQPLGDWLYDLSKCRISNFAYRYQRRLFIRTQSGYRRCRLVQPNKFHETGHTVTREHIPSRAHPVEATTAGQHAWTIIHSTHVLLEVDSCQRPPFFYAFTISDDISTSFAAGSDGSEKYGTDGAFGWMISNDSGERVAAGMGPSRGWRMDSYRAECSGMLSLLRFLIRLGAYTFHVGSWNGTIGTDSRSMLEKLFGTTRVREGDYYKP